MHLLIQLFLITCYRSLWCLNVKETDADLMIQGKCNILDCRHFKTKESQIKLVICYVRWYLLQFWTMLGLLTLMSAECNCILNIYCANYGMQLALKVIIKETAFRKAGNLYNSLYFFFKNFGKGKSKITEASAIYLTKSQIVWRVISGHTLRIAEQVVKKILLLKVLAYFGNSFARIYRQELWMDKRPI